MKQPFSIVAELLLLGALELQPREEQQLSLLKEIKVIHYVLDATLLFGSFSPVSFVHQFIQTGKQKAFGKSAMDSKSAPKHCEN